jgi:hypothetical protein
MAEVFIPENPEIPGKVAATLEALRKYKRGDNVPWSVFEGSIGCARTDPLFQQPFQRVRRDFRRETGIVMWPVGGNGGMRLLTIKEQLDLPVAKRRAKALRQHTKMRNEVSALPDEQLSARQRMVKEFQLKEVTEGRRALLRQIHHADNALTDKESCVPRPASVPVAQPMVYFMRAEDGRVRVEVAASLSAFGPGLECIGAIPGGKDKEGAVRFRLSRWKLADGWYEDSQTLRDYIAANAPKQASA